MERQFKGWIPTVGGSLSFSIIGETYYPSKTKYANVSDGINRCIVCIQKRRLNDSVLPFDHLLTYALYKYETRHWGVCVAKCSDSLTDMNAGLEGHLFLFSGKSQRARWICSEMSTRLEEFSIDDKEPFLKECFDDECNKYFPELINLSSVGAKFHLKRNGDFSLSPLPDLKNAPTFPSPVMERKVYSQLFFFFKDITHRHQHHDESTDTMIDLYEANDDITWRCETLRSIYRAVLRFKRIKKENVCESSLGILAYIKSFKNISQQELNDNEYKRIKPIFNDELLTESIKASQDTIKRESQHKIEILNKSRNIFFGFVGIFFSFFSVLNLVRTQIEHRLVSPHSWFVNFANFMLGNPIIFISIIVGLFVLIRMAYIGVDLFKWKLYRSIFRLFQAFPLYVSASVFLFFGLLGSYYMYMYVEHIYENFVVPVVPVVPCEFLIKV